MRRLKKLGVLATAALALSLISVATAPAAQFTYSATGELEGEALETQVFTVNAGAITCKKAATSGTIVQLPPVNEQHVTVKYSECTGPLGVPVDPVEATYLFTAAGQVHIKKEIKVVVTNPFGTCEVRVPEQTVGAVSYATNGTNIKMTPNVTGVKYTTTGDPCGSGGENGTYKGADEVHRVGGGSLAFDP